MKKLILLLSVFLLSQFGIHDHLSAQKAVNVDNLRFDYKERDMPKKYFNPRFFYFSPQFSVPQSVKVFMQEEELANRLLIQNQRRTQDKKAADMIVNIIMEPIEIVDCRIERRTEQKKMKKGDTIRTRYFWLELEYSFSAKAEAIDKRNDVVVSRYEMQNRKVKKIFKSEEYDNPKAVDIYWANNEGVIRERLTRQEAFEAVDKLSDMMKDQYSCLITKSYSLIKTINEANHPENTTLRRMTRSLASKFSSLDGTNPLREEDIKVELDYFMDILKRYPLLDMKVDARLRYVALYNICRIYLFLDQPEKVHKWATLILENRYDTKDKDRLINDAIKLQKKLSEGVGARQFDPQDYFR